jgi:signal transduction protein with GAF and PtsI domain
MPITYESGGYLDVDCLHQIGAGISALPLPKVLTRTVLFVSAIVRCDSCFIYVPEGDELVLRASKNPHDNSLGRVRLGREQGITGWVAEHKVPVAIARKAYQDPRFRAFDELPEDRYEAFLSVPVLSRDKLAGIINVQHRRTHFHSQRDIQLLSTIGFLVGSEIELARLEEENGNLSREQDTRRPAARHKKFRSAHYLAARTAL